MMKNNNSTQVTYARVLFVFKEGGISNEND